jgi:hypothetical protein
VAVLGAPHCLIDDPLGDYGQLGVFGLTDALQLLECVVRGSPRCGPGARKYDDHPTTDLGLPRRLT